MVPCARRTPILPFGQEAQISPDERARFVRVFGGALEELAFIITQAFLRQRLMGMGLRS